MKLEKLYDILMDTEQYILNHNASKPAEYIEVPILEFQRDFKITNLKYT